jgi:RNA polymerase subunit RPABC4/transcription elongation factor Spt4
VKFRVCFEGHEFTLPNGESIVGRDAVARVRIDHPSVSRRHARILVVGDDVSIEDIGSKNGVELNGARIEGPARVGDGDVIKVGGIEFTLRYENAFEVQEVTSTEGPAYETPIYRTCVKCRSLMERGDGVCGQCGAEQDVDEFALRLWTDPVGRRMAPRVGVRLRGLYVSTSMTIEGEVSDLSAGGAFFACELLDQTGTLCDLLILPSDEGEVVRFTAEVARVSDKTAVKSGVGLRFVKMTAPAQSWLKAVVAAGDKPPRGGNGPNRS